MWILQRVKYTQKYTVKFPRVKYTHVITSVEYPHVITRSKITCDFFTCEVFL